MYPDTRSKDRVMRQVRRELTKVSAQAVEAKPERLG
jgi:hypothetical protein